MAQAVAAVEEGADQARVEPVASDGHQDKVDSACINDHSVEIESCRPPCSVLLTDIRVFAVLLEVQRDLISSFNID